MQPNKVEIEAAEMMSLKLSSDVCPSVIKLGKVIVHTLGQVSSLSLLGNLFSIFNGG